MHCDYQLAYCLIMYIVSLVFRDNAFENERLTPEYIWQLQVPKSLRSQPLRWKKSKLKNPILRRTVQTPYGVELHPNLPMAYDSSNSGFKNLGEGAGYEGGLDHYNFRRWAGNE
jgi:hypothetical protein